MLALAGERTQLASRLADRPWTPVQGPLGFVSASPAVMGIEVGHLIGDHALIRSGADAVRSLVEMGVRITPGWPLFVPRLAAVAAAIEGDRGEAERAFDRARAMAVAAGLETEIGRIDLDMVELGLADNPMRSAADAATRLDATGALVFAIRAQREAHLTDEGPAIRVVLVVDLVGSTALNSELGNVAYHEVVTEFTALLRSSLRESGGVEFKHTGDGMCAWYSSAVAAVGGAEDIHARLAARNHEDTAAKLVVRAGLAAGEPVPDHGDLFGIEVARASRLSDLAPDGSTLVSAEVVSMAEGDRFSFRPAGERELKGIPGRTPMYMVES
jgi:class 3 adenylate cyclase